MRVAYVTQYDLADRIYTKAYAMQTKDRIGKLQNTAATQARSYFACNLLNQIRYGMINRFITVFTTAGPLNTILRQLNPFHVLFPQDLSYCFAVIHS